MLFRSALFGEFLRARAADALPAAALQALRLQAAGLLAAHGHADAAISQLIHAEAWAEALVLLDAHAGRFTAQGRTRMVSDWILALPENTRASAQACYWLGFCELAVDPVTALAHLERAHQGFVAAGDALGAFYAAAAAADAVVFIGANLHAIEPWMAVLESGTPAYLARRDA